MDKPKLGHGVTPTQVIWMVADDFGVNINVETAQQIIEANNLGQLTWTPRRLTATGKFNLRITTEGVSE